MPSSSSGVKNEQPFLTAKILCCLLASMNRSGLYVHQSYMDKVRAEDSDTDKLTAALILRLLIVGRKTLHRHKAEQLEGGHLQEMGDVLN